MQMVTVLKRVRRIKKELLELRDGMMSKEEWSRTGPGDSVTDAANLILNAEKQLMTMEAHRAGLVVKACLVRKAKRQRYSN